MSIADKLTVIATAKKNIKQAIEAKGVQVGNVSLTQYADKINAIEVGGGGETTPQFTGHADVEGLKAIGWTDDDIAYYQKYGVTWNKEDDQYHKVPEENIALYSVINADNYKEYSAKIVYMPKIDFSKKTSMASGFNGFTSLVAIPSLDFSSATTIAQLCIYDRCLVCVGPLKTTSVTVATSVFSDCTALRRHVEMDLSKADDISSIYSGCYSLKSVVFDNLNSLVNAARLCYNCYSLKTVVLPAMENVTVAENAFYNCYSIESIEITLGSKLKKVGSLCYWNWRLTKLGTINMANVTDWSTSVFNYCYSLTDIRLRGAKGTIDWSAAKWLNKDSLVYAINNASGGCTIKLHSIAYARLSSDADVASALASKTYVSLASA